MDHRNSNTMNMKSVLLSIALPLSFALSVSAQTPVDIGVHRNGNMLDVKVRPTAASSGIVSAVVFTLRWDASSGATLGQVAQEGPVATYIPIRTSGPVRQQDGMNYQVYAGFGMTPMGENGWTAGNEYVIATIPVNGGTDIELVNDGWTQESKNNANFYLSIGGVDRTGVIYKGLAGADEDGSVSILPNPNNGVFTFSFGVSEASNITVQLMNTLGQEVFSDAINNFSGTYRKDMDISSMSSGVYYLKIKQGEETTTHKVVYR